MHHKPEIPFADFEKVEIRVGTLITVEELPNSQKLFKLTVDFGDNEKRVILTGLKKLRPDLNNFTGKQFLFVLNLPQKPMAGENSQGMILALDSPDSQTPVFVFPERIVQNGSLLC